MNGETVLATRSLRERAGTWMAYYTGWSIGTWQQVGAREPEVLLLDPAGHVQLREPSLGLLMDGLEQSDLRAKEEAARLALLRAKFAPWCVVADLDRGEWEATLHGVHKITAFSGVAMSYRLHRRARQ